MHVLRTLLALLLVSTFSATYCAAQNPDYQLTVEQQCDVGSAVSTKVMLGNDGSNVSGWSFGVCHDAAVLNVLDVVNGAATATVNNGAPPAFNGISQFPDGYTIGAVVDLVNSFFLPMGDFELYTGTYEYLTTPGVPTDIDFCETLGSPPVSILITLTSIVGLLPVTSGDTVLPLGCFCEDVNTYTGRFVTFEEVTPGPLDASAQNAFLGLGVSVTSLAGGIEVVQSGPDLDAVSPPQLLANPDGVVPTAGVLELDFADPTTGDDAVVTRASVVLVSSDTGTATVTAYDRSDAVVGTQSVTGVAGGRERVELMATEIDRLEINLDLGLNRFGVDDLCFDQPMVILEPPVITTDPGDVTVCEGGAAQFMVAATSALSLSYQWFLDGAPIAGATSATYEIASTLLSDAGEYVCDVTNNDGTTSSASAQLVVNPLPVIDTPPQPRLACPGETHTFSVLATGSGLTYQWALDGTPIPGATGADYVIASVMPGDTGTYTVTVTAAMCEVTTAGATLNLLTPIQITGQPAGANLCVGDMTTLSVAAQGSPTLSYQWRLDGADISGANASSYEIAAAAIADAGSYDVVVSNPCGSATSDPAVVTVISRPAITMDPTTQIACTGDPITLSVATNPNVGVSYQWMLDSNPIPGATGSSYSIAAATLADGGVYSVVASVGACSVTSADAMLTIIDPVVITTQPSDADLCVGETLAVTVVASGAEPLDYQWRLDGSDLPGATLPTYTVASAQLIDAGAYDCVVSNPCSSATTDSAVVTVTDFPTIDTNPLDTEGCLGAPVTLSVTTTPAGVDYQWFLDGTPIAGATDSSYEILSAVAGDAGTYRVNASVGNCTVSSTDAVLTLLDPITITQQPVPADLCAGDDLTLTIAASGSAPLTYQWRLNGTDIVGATADTYSVTGAQTSAAGSYDCVVTNDCGAVTSDTATVVVSPFPMILTTATPMNGCVGELVSLTVDTDPDTGLTYQWFLDGAPIAGANAATYEIAAASAADAGAYTVEASIGSCVAGGAITTLTILEPVAITTQPADAALCTGDPLTLIVAATGTPTLTYQWRLDGTPIAGATGATYDVASTQAADSGSYDVVVTNDCGSVTSAPAVVAVVTTPTITTDLQDLEGCLGATVTLEIVTDPASGVDYQWFLDGAPIAGATNASYVIAAATATDAGVYHVDVNVGSCGIQSAAATLTLLTPITITTQPVGADLCAGDPLSLSVAASGTAPLTYQWRLDGSDITGATAATYDVAASQTSDAGNYEVLVTNGCGTTTSDSVAVAVTAFPTITTQPADQAGCLGTALDLTVLTDPDTGVDYQWFLNGTAIPGATAATYSINTPVAGDAGSYTVEISAGSCSVTSDSATVTLDEPVTITLEPSAAVLCVGDALDLIVAATGTAPLSYQWRLDGMALPGATNAAYSVAAAALTDAGSYDVVVTNSCGSVTSAAAAVSVGNTPVVTTQPMTTQGCIGLPVTLTVVSDPATGVVYQWFLDGAPIAGANAASYDIAAADATDAGTYTVEISAGSCQTLSDPAILTLIDAVTITSDPTGTDLCVGDALDLAVAANGSGTLTYQWRLDGSDIAGANAATYSVAAAALTDGGSYDVVVTNACGSVTSAAAVVTVANAPSIVTQPMTMQGCIGLPVTLTVVSDPATGVVYQWFLDGAPIAGANAASYDIAAADATDSGTYTVEISAGSCQTLSDPAILTLIDAVTITSDPTGTDLCVGDPLDLAVAANGSGTLTYQWRLDGSDIAGANAATYSVAAAALTDGGSYDVVVTNSCGSVTSAAATVNVTDAPTIVTDPTDTLACLGQSVTLDVVADPAVGVAYQWFLDGTPIAGATGASYTISTATLADAGAYTVTVSAGSCSVTSASATLTVLESVLVTQNPIGADLCVGDMLQLTASATGAGPLAFQWRLNGSDVPGATSSTYTIPAATLSDGGTYDVVVTNACSTATSAGATVNVFGTPVVTTDPVAQTGCIGDSVTFFVAATGVSLTYQWHFNGTDIVGANSASLPITVDAASAGVYGCTVSAGPCSVESATATLLVLDPITITAQPLGFTACEGFDFDLTVTATGSALIEYQWQVDGTPIVGATSSTLTLLGVTLADAGDYTVVVQNDCGSVLSSIATLAVTPVADCDCDGNLVLDADELAMGTALDCNTNGVIDSCDIANGTSLDADLDGVPDECQAPQFLRGDCIADGTIDIVDATRGLDYLFSQGVPPVLECLDACDVNDDEFYDIADPIYTLFALFLNTHPIPPPFGTCGPDPTAGSGALGCDFFGTCP